MDSVRLLSTRTTHSLSHHTPRRIPHRPRIPLRHGPARRRPHGPAQRHRCSRAPRPSLSPARRRRRSPVRRHRWSPVRSRGSPAQESSRRSSWRHSHSAARASSSSDRVHPACAVAKSAPCPAADPAQPQVQPRRRRSIGPSTTAGPAQPQVQLRIPRCINPVNDAKQATRPCASLRAPNECKPAHEVLRLGRFALIRGACGHAGSGRG